jgi:hypothetical protein
MPSVKNKPKRVRERRVRVLAYLKNKLVSWNTTLEQTPENSPLHEIYTGIVQRIQNEIDTLERRVGIA